MLSCEGSGHVRVITLCRTRMVSATVTVAQFGRLPVWVMVAETTTVPTASPLSLISVAVQAVPSATPPVRMETSPPVPSMSFSTCQVTVSPAARARTPTTALSSTAMASGWFMMVTAGAVCTFTVSEAVLRQPLASVPVTV